MDVLSNLGEQSTLLFCLSDVAGAANHGTVVDKWEKSQEQNKIEIWEKKNFIALASRHKSAAQKI